jgi:hypothetical protein
MFILTMVLYKPSLKPTVCLFLHIFLVFQSLINVCCLAQPTNKKPQRTSKAKATSAIPPVLDDIALASTVQDGAGLRLYFILATQLLFQLHQSVNVVERLSKHERQWQLLPLLPPPLPPPYLLLLPLVSSLIMPF